MKNRRFLGWFSFSAAKVRGQGGFANLNLRNPVQAAFKQECSRPAGSQDCICHHGNKQKRIRG